MSRRPGQRDVLYEGGPALKELIETYATMDIKAFCAKWDLAIATVRSTASRRGLLRLRVKVPKKDTATTGEDPAGRVFPQYWRLVDMAKEGDYLLESTVWVMKYANGTLFN